MADLSRIIGIIEFAPEDVDRMSQATKRQKPACNCKIDTGADQQDNQGQTPGYINCGGPETTEDFQNDILLLMMNRLTRSIAALPDNILDS